MSESVYRFFNSDTGVHFYTAKEEERDFIQNNLPGFNFEGASYQGIDPLTGAGQPLPVYRFLNQDTGVHLYTISETERSVVENSSSFTYEGEAFLAYNTEVEGTIPIYRFYNSATGAHFYTPSAVEKDNIKDNLSGFVSEGIAYYALPATDPKEILLPENDFAIEIVFGEGTKNFTPEMREAINKAADVWENAILQSTLDEEHLLTIEVEGADLGEDGFVAKANLKTESLEIDADYNLFPTEGYSTVNTNEQVISTFSSDIEQFTDIMTHEFAHVMGFGNLWRMNSLINPMTGVYFADSKAGLVYNRDNNTTGVDIPLTTNEGTGSDLAHWQEETFGNELMTHEIEVSGISNPLSELTLASLEDIGWNVNYEVAELYPDSSTNLASFW